MLELSYPIAKGAELAIFGPFLSALEQLRVRNPCRRSECSTVEARRTVAWIRETTLDDVSGVFCCCCLCPPFDALLLPFFLRLRLR